MTVNFKKGKGLMSRLTKRTVIATIVVVGASYKAKAQNLPFIQEEIIKVAGVTSDAQIYSLSNEQKQTTRHYLDGLGRDVQTVAVGASPQQHDIIGINTYDQLGRQLCTYLPYTGNNSNGSYRPNAISEQAAFYINGTADKIADDPNPYSEQVFENSPLQRLLLEGSVGDGFQPGQHSKTMAYRQNTAADDVWRWSVQGARDGSYPAATLYVTQGTDEQGNQTLIFTDSQGKTVLKRQLANETVNGTIETWFDTYYMYNLAGLITAIIPPKAISQMRSSSSYDLNQPSVSRLLFCYGYDERGRLVEKQVPEAAPLYIVYDPLERPVLLQDGKLRSSNKWNYIKYDAKGRVVSQGMYTDATRTSRAAMQAYVNGLDYSSRWYEDRTSTSPSGYYSNLVFPTSNTEPLAYSYFDDYDLNQDGTADYTYQAQGLPGEAASTSLTRGLLTIVRKRTVGAGLSNIWLLATHFYDKYGNVIQVRSNNHLNTGINDTKTIVPDFTGTIRHLKVVKAATSGSTSVISSFSYDHSGRLLSIDDSYNGATAVRVATYEYNEIGQLVDKKLHSTNGGNSHLQSVDFRYNIRSQLININNSSLTVDSKNDDSDDVFGMELLYEHTESSIGNSAYYNGQLSAVKWKSKNPQNTAPQERSYHFDYDKLSRLKNALYKDRPAAGNWTASGAFDEKNIRYDQNGNILGLERNAYISGTITAMDNLSYTYSGNQLTNISDGASASLGYKNLTGSTGPYTYDESGSLLSDPKKGISHTYNILSRTEKVTITTSSGRYINYTYDALGILLRKQAFDNNTLVKTTDYIEGFVYENGTLSHFPMAEGRVRNTGSSLKGEYMIKDHQGNVRVSFEEQNGQAVVRQENSYYPYGLVMPGGSLPTQPNRNLYNGGSEWQNDYGDLPDYYQTRHRNYDPSTGRFVCVDPLTELSSDLSPYQYGNNNPVQYNDPLGDVTRRNSVQQDMYEAMESTWMLGGSLGYYRVHTGRGRQQAGSSLGGAASWGEVGAAINGLWNMAGENGRADYNFGAGSLQVWDAMGDPVNSYPAAGHFIQFPDDTRGDIIIKGGNYFIPGAPVVTANSGGNVLKAGFADDMGQVLNLGGVVWGGAELGIQAVRQNNGPQAIGKFLGFGTQRTAAALRGTLGTVSNLGKRLGTAGYLLSVGTYVSALANSKKISTATHVNFGVSTVLYGAAYLTVGTLAAPYVAGAALVYGVGELGSWIYNGKTLEENLIGR